MDAPKAIKRGTVQNVQPEESVMREPARIEEGFGGLKAALSRSVRTAMLEIFLASRVRLALGNDLIIGKAAIAVEIGRRDASSRSANTKNYCSMSKPAAE